MKKVAIVMGSVSDLPVVEKAIKTLQEFDVPHEVHVYSAHLSWFSTSLNYYALSSS